MKPNSTAILSLLVEGIDSGGVKVIDFTQSLSRQTPVIGLPPPLASSPGFSREVVSRYDDKGNHRDWNILHFGEPTRTHFNAANHWITGRDLPNNPPDTIPASRIIGPACFNDCSPKAAASEDFLPARGHVLEWEAQDGRSPPGAWLLMRANWSERLGADQFLNQHEHGPHSPHLYPDFSRRSVRLSVWTWNTLAPMPVKIIISIRPFPITASCTGRGSSASRRFATWTRFRRSGLLFSPPRSKWWTDPEARSACWRSHPPSTRLTNLKTL
ncbi:MAG: hypothetical protein RIS76_4609 [Verrucomicrobiota bacterium]|jgi:kynurenine formamidase